MQQDLYSRLGKELRELFKDINHFNQTKIKAIRKQMDKILEMSASIGGSVKNEALALSGDVLKYLEKPGDPKLVAIIRQHALRLEQETREL